MRALVTGAAGFLGSHVVERLVTAGHGVEAIDDLSGGSLANLSVARAEAQARGIELKVHTLDVRAPELAELVHRRRPDVVYHLAARHDSARGAADMAWSSTLNVLEAARSAASSKVVVAVDALALYRGVSPRDLPVKEGAVAAPTTLAGAAVRAIVDLLAAYRAEHAIECTTLALASVYGPRSTRGPVAAFLRCAEQGAPCAVDGDGRQTRDLLYVDDAVDAFVRAATRGSGLVVNVGTGVQTAIRDLERLVAGPGAPLPTRRPPKPDEVGRFAVSPVRARIHLAWAPWTALPDGIEATRAAFSGTGRSAVP